MRASLSLSGQRWRRTRQAIQVGSTILFFLLAALTFRGSQFILPLDLFFRLDPLVASMSMIASRTLMTGLLLSVASLGLGLVFGRAWCGWLCPLGAVLDIFSPRSPRKAEARPSWRRAKYVLLFLVLTAAITGNLTLAFLDPLTLLNRTLAGSIVSALNIIVVGVETMLYPFEQLQAPLEWFEQSIRGTLLPAQQTFYQLGWLLALVFAGIVGLNWVASRFWCRYLCPLGAIYALEAKISILRPRAISECDHCAQCLRVCPTGAISVTKNGFTVDPAECVLCMDCSAECPRSAIQFGVGGNQSEARSSVDLSRRHFVAGTALGVVAVSLLRSEPSEHRDDPALIRPPGARENDFLTKCLRCAECTKVCPTGGLQPSLFQSGLSGLWTPVLIPRLGYCDFSCNSCGQICPTGAIPSLSLAAKRTTVIGVAYIDQNRCIPWTSYRPCIVCQEMCPVPEKAVKLEEVDVTTPDGKQVHLQRPRMQPELCIGCGICEYQCPLVGPAAIRVYPPTQLPPLVS